jgi:hypothetical protein
MDKEVQAEFRELLLQRLEELYQEAERTVRRGDRRGPFEGPPGDDPLYRMQTQTGSQRKSPWLLRLEDRWQAGASQGESLS